MSVRLLSFLFGGPDFEYSTLNPFFFRYMKETNPEEVYKEDGTRDELASRINHAANRYSKGEP